MKKLLGFLISLGLLFNLTPLVNAGANDPLVFYLEQNHAATPVDYLTWCGDCVGVDYHTGTPRVVNSGDYWPFTDIPYGQPPTSSEPGCAWDSDDFYEYRSTGNVIDIGATLTIKACRYNKPGGSFPKLYTDMHLTSSSNALIVKTSWISDNETKTYTATPVFNNSTRLWEYFACVSSPIAQGATVTIPNSNGGQAVIQKIVITITNPTSRKITKTGGVFKSGIQDAWCNSWIEI